MARLGRGKNRTLILISFVVVLVGCSDGSLEACGIELTPPAIEGPGAALVVSGAGPQSVSELDSVCVPFLLQSTLTSFDYDRVTVEHDGPAGVAVAAGMPERGPEVGSPVAGELTMDLSEVSEPFGFRVSVGLESDDTSVSVDSFFTVVVQPAGDGAEVELVEGFTSSSF